MNYDGHIEPSASVKGASYFNVFECGRNLLDQLDVTYQRAFIASETSSAEPTGLYDLFPVRERYYDMQVNHIKEKNVGMDEDEICKVIYRVKLEDEAEHEHNIEYLAQEDDDYKSPWKIEDAEGLKAVTDSSYLGKSPLQQGKSQTQILKH